ncbi:hypothetical protein Pcar_3376 [Syntrophotalea carbinolica DSM 2380]|uniref:Uncharacterized protein n=1 Tax=Syntrophotalea carbinolica (strain DSM 2380 / NBRC 103641 / GraBd1) TaxID=338963 RepID=Q0C6E7_SYNC1|nr:hypothetical protein Pcar_3376 [Syntrophotalea carbinolica DSM 2380]
MIKCGLCGYEFERGVKICRGCHGTVKYGAGGLKWLFGIIYGTVIFYALRYVNDHWLTIQDKIALPIILCAFVLGAIHAAYLFRNQVKTVKVVAK